MMRSPIRRVDVARSWQRAREQFADLIAERDAYAKAHADLHEVYSRHVDQIDGLRRELHELRSIFEDVVRCLREQAEQNVDDLRHQLEVLLARLERDPAQPLN